MSGESGFTFCCFQCKEPAFLIRGYCSKCAPALHQSYEASGKAVKEMCDRFETETGKAALGAWYEFEQWWTRQPDAVQYATTLKTAMLTPAPNGALYHKLNER